APAGPPSIPSPGSEHRAPPSAIAIEARPIDRFRQDARPWRGATCMRDERFERMVKTTRGEGTGLTAFDLESSTAGRSDGAPAVEHRSDLSLEMHRKADCRL